MAITSYTQVRPAAVQATLVTNYLDFTAGNNDWAQQYLPDLMEKEAEVYGKRTISGFLAQVGAEEAMSSDRVVWSEQGRLHLSYKGTVITASSGLVEIDTDIDGLAQTTTHGIRVGDTVVLSSATKTLKCYVSVAARGTSAGTNDRVTCLPYSQAALSTGSTFADDDAISVFVYGSEFSKGVDGQNLANEPSVKSFENKPIILKDTYIVSGSDTASIGWIETSGEEGQSGFMWYLKAEGDTRARFSDYLEMSMLESELADTTATIHDATGGLAVNNTSVGTEGLFSAIASRGHESSGVTGVNAATDLAEFDAMLAVFDANGAIEENMMFVNRATALAMDDMLASMNSYGAGGTSYGVFDNSEDMALNLGFSGFRRGSYDFYKSDMKYLNDKSTRGGSIDTVNAIRGVVIPAGVSSVYDEQLGKNMKRPFLHVRYRASQTESRKMKTWITGSVGAQTSDLDAMQVNYLSERCLITQGANNFMLLN